MRRAILCIAIMLVCVMHAKPFELALKERPNALVSVPVASLRAEAKHSAEMETQALMGTPIYVMPHSDEWYAALLPDGYQAFIPVSSVQLTDSVAMQQWRTADRLICIDPFEGHIFASPSTTADVVSDFSLGCIVEPGANRTDEFTEVILPDRRNGWVESRRVAPFGEWMSRQFDRQRVLDICKSLMGSAYLWGGRSAKGVDCSGMTQLAFFDSGIMLPRNASQQALCGIEPDQLQTADLLFFANEQGRVIHVAVYDHDTLYVHSSGRVHVSSFDPDNGLYNGRVVTSRRRINSNPNIITHPWYFDI